MARQRNWDSLSESYRNRLERGGITRSAYESGVSVSAARGHAATPERPSQAINDEERYREYIGRRDNAVRTIQRAKEAMFGTSERWDVNKSLRYVNRDLDGQNRNADFLRKAARIAALAANGDIDLNEIRDEYPDIWEVFFYN